VRLAERVLAAVLRGDPSSTVGRARLKGAIELRRALVRLGDPIVRYGVGEVVLELPLSHQLPFFRQDHPEYDAAIGRIAALLGGPVVDIGANVGDTAASIRSLSDVPVLCVEGDERFFALLERNAHALAPVELERAFVEGPERGRVERAAGTARVVAGDEELPSKPLARVLDEHPRFAQPALLKLDTDGMDVPILLANLELLGRLRPVVFFEYDPQFGAVPEVFRRLREVGYERMLVYENTGELARAGPVDPWPHDAYSGFGGARYADVCTFHRDDERSRTVERMETGRRKVPSLQ
jgi:FkbM family methyltransferase